MGSIASGVLLTTGAEIVSLLFGSAVSQWAIYASGTSDAAILPDSFSTIDVNADARVSDYPIEQGGFESYNKVMVPKEARVLLVCSGRAMSRDAFLDQLEAMRDGTDLYDVATPDYFYTNTSLTRFNYKRSASNGVTMISAEVLFEEIREAASPTYSSSGALSSNSPSAASPTSLGAIHPGDTVSVSFNGPPEPQPVQ